MEEFTVKGGGDFIKIELSEVFGFPEETCHWGGYDTRATLVLKIGSYNVKSDFYTSTGEIYNLYVALAKSNKTLTGKVEYSSYEGNLILSLTYNKLGQIMIEGEFREKLHLRNQLSFEFESDQSYISSSLVELEKIVEKYGGMTGKKRHTT